MDSRILRGMSLEDKVGQLFVVDVRSANTPDQVIRRFRPGGVIYFGDNVDNPAQVAEFSNKLQSAAHLPLLVGIDQEGGRVTRIAAPATEYPSSMAIGAGRSSADAEQLAMINGRELRAMGINQNFAPVADVNSNPLNPIIGSRSFSADPALTARLVAAEVAGYQKYVSAVAKHFPGHGDAATDSHTGLPVIARTEADWHATDLPPFRAAIDAGADAIMTAHIAVPCLDPSGVPATLSKPIITGILREELHYDGVVVTDSLQMAGVRQLHSDAEIPVLALEAGADQLLMPADLGVALDGVLDAVERGRLTEQRIDQSVLRILALKDRRGILANPFVSTPDVGTPPHLEAIQVITDRTTTVLRDDANVLPLKNPGRIAVTGWNDASSPVATLAAELHATGQVETADTVVVLTNGLRTCEPQHNLVAALLATGKPVIAVAVQEPYDAGYADVPTWIATYDWRDVTMRSLAKVLLGKVPAQGRLPVRVSDAYPFGAGLTSTVLRHGTPAEVGLDPAPIKDAERFLDTWPRFPGAVGLLVHEGVIVEHYATGYALRYADACTEVPADQQVPMRPDTIFDMASVTKLFTSIAALQLVERGAVDLDAPVATYLPGFGKQQVTVRQLLTHTSGLAAEPRPPLWHDDADIPARQAALLASPLVNEPGTTYVYSDVNLMALGLLVEQVTGAPLDDVVRERITRPLGMADTGFTPPATKLDRIAATEYQADPPRGLVRGQVHDENAWALGGVAGHAGIFSTAYDMAVLGQAVLNGGSYGDARILLPQTVRDMLADHHGHGLGFELNRPFYMGELSSPSTAGHTGFAGTALVLDPRSRSIAILLTNRVHPTRHRGSINRARELWATALAKAIRRS